MSFVYRQQVQERCLQRIHYISEAMIKEKKKSVQTLIKEADTAFSIFIRLRDADERGTITCPTCGTRVYYRDADCCHLITRGQMATRYEEMNAVGGCVECNRYNSTEHLAKLREFLIEQFGPDVIEQMEFMAHKTLKKFMPFELEEIRDGYKEIIKSEYFKSKKHLV